MNENAQALEKLRIRREEIRGLITWASGTELLELEKQLRELDEKIRELGAGPIEL